jgi:hypothetical protein
LAIFLYHFNNSNIGIGVVVVGCIEGKVVLAESVFSPHCASDMSIAASEEGTPDSRLPPGESCGAGQESEKAPHV